MQLTRSPIDSIKLEWLRLHDPDAQNYVDTFTFFYEEKHSTMDERGEQEAVLLARLEKARSYQLGTLIRLELSYLSQHYIDHSEWEKAIHVAVEEEELANTAIEKMECLRRQLIGYMAKKDYIRAALIVERLEQTFPSDKFALQNDDFSFFNDSQDKCRVEEVIFLLLILSMVRGELTDYVKALYQERHHFSLFSNGIDRTAYNFIFAVMFDRVPSESAYFGDTLSVLKDWSGLEQFISRDPWLSGIDNVVPKLLNKLKSTLKGRLLNIEKCPNVSVRAELQSLLI